MDIKVEWKLVGGEIKGRILEDAAGRRKIVFVHRNHRDRTPKHGEITVARVAKDTKPESKTHGALLVLPIIPPEAGALSDEDAKAKFREMIKAHGIQFGRRTIEVDLPGWKGYLEPKFMKQNPRQPQPLAIHWVYQSEHSQRWFYIGGEGGMLEHIITRGIVGQPDNAVVVDWLQAVHDLGEPESVTVGDTYTLASWRDATGSIMEASVSREVAMRTSLSIEDMRLDAEAGLVVGDLVLLGGRWRLGEEMLGTTERTGSTISPAVVESRHKYLLNGQDLRKVEALLRSARHTAAHHHARCLQMEVGKDGDPSYTLRHLVNKLEEFVGNSFAPPSWADTGLTDITRKRENIRKMLGQPSIFRQDGDPSIYDGSPPPDDADETERMLAEIHETLRNTDAEVELLREQVGSPSVRDRLNDPSLLKRGEEAIEQLYQRYLALSESARKQHLPYHFSNEMEYRKTAMGVSRDPEYRLGTLYVWLKTKEAHIAKAEKAVASP